MPVPGFLARLFGSSRVQLDRRYERLQESITGTMSQFYKARDHETGGIAE